MIIPCPICGSRKNRDFTDLLSWTGTDDPAYKNQVRYLTNLPCLPCQDQHYENTLVAVKCRKEYRKLVKQEMLSIFKPANGLLSIEVSDHQPMTHLIISVKTHWNLDMAYKLGTLEVHDIIVFWEKEEIPL